MKFRCPKCEKMLDRQSGLGHQLAEPPPGANLICFYCETICVVGMNKLTVASEEYLKSLPFFCRMELEQGLQMVRSIKRDKTKEN